LSKGKVKFTDTKSKKYEIMKVNEKITLNKNVRKLKKETVTNANFLSWKTKELNLNNMKLSEIANVISDFYNINIKADNSVKDSIYHTTLPFSNAKPEDILNSIKYGMSIEIDSINDEIILKKQENK